MHDDVRLLRKSQDGWATGVESYSHVSVVGVGCVPP
jgi:hypothetical protein